MSEKKYSDDDPERTLVTLDQLSQTIEVMTSVVNRLRRHLSEQIQAQLEAQEEMAAESDIKEASSRPEKDSTQQSTDDKRESFVVEISQQEVEPAPKPTKTLH